LNDPTQIFDSDALTFYSYVYLSKWQGLFECNQRVGFLMEKKKMTEGEAKESLMAEGHCKP
jgi:hypothetical protein